METKPAERKRRRTGGHGYQSSDEPIGDRISPFDDVDRRQGATIRPQNHEVFDIRGSVAELLHQVEQDDPEQEADQPHSRIRHQRRNQESRDKQGQEE